jgi:hypothetical protein
MNATDQTQILTVEFLASGSFDYWIDDLGFY